jgi:hypothetical protein
MNYTRATLALCSPAELIPQLPRRPKKSIEIPSQLQNLTAESTPRVPTLETAPVLPRRDQVTPTSGHGIFILQMPSRWVQSSALAFCSTVVLSACFKTKRAQRRRATTL